MPTIPNINKSEDNQMKSTLKRALALMLTLTLALTLAPLTQPIASAAGDDWKAAYAEEVIDFANINREVYDLGLRFSLYDIDNNGIPELIIEGSMFGIAGMYCLAIYTYSNGTLKSVNEKTPPEGDNMGSLHNFEAIIDADLSGIIYSNSGYWTGDQFLIHWESINWLTIDNNYYVRQTILFRESIMDSSEDNENADESTYYANSEVAQKYKAGTLKTKPIEFYEATPANIAKYIYGYGDSNYTPNWYVEQIEQIEKTLQIELEKRIEAGTEFPTSYEARQSLYISMSYKLINLDTDNSQELIIECGVFGGVNVHRYVYVLDIDSKFFLLSDGILTSDLSEGFDWSNVYITDKGYFICEKSSGRNVRPIIVEKISDGSIVEKSESRRETSDFEDFIEANKSKYGIPLDIDFSNSAADLAKIYAMPGTPALSATPTGAKVQVNGKDIPFDAYTINGQTYYQLADIARSVSATTKKFSAAFKDGAIYVTRGTAMSGSISPKGTGNKTPTPTQAKIYIDGVETAITAYTMDGHTYYQMKEIAKNFNFGVGFADGTIMVDTSADFGL
jgi:hypothetical protein